MPWRSALDNVTAGLQFRGEDRAGRAGEGRGVARARGPRGLRRPLPAPALRRHEEARLARADAHPRPADPAHGRAFLRARRADAADDGERAAGAVERRTARASSSSPTTSRRRSRSPTASWCSPPGPATRPIGEYVIDLPRPRDVSEIRLTPRFIELHDRIWHAMKDEVLKGYAQTRNRVTGEHEKEALDLAGRSSSWRSSGSGTWPRTRTSSRPSCGTTPTAPPSSSASR